MLDQASLFLQTDQLIDDMAEPMLSDLLWLISCNSVGTAATGDDQPFGSGVASALETALAISQKFGFITQNIDGYMGIADIPGKADAAVGILAHVDVVPVNEADWHTPPFTGKVENGCIYGRGALDDKGPLIASIYACAALKQALDQPLNKTIRLMFGGNEESGMECLKYYLSRYQQPECGFSPDAEFPLIIGEKGIIQFQLSQSWDKANAAAPLTLTSIKAGDAINIVPAKAEARLAINQGSIPRGSDKIAIREEGGQLIITAIGKAAHASTPWDGDNALAALLSFLATQKLEPAAAECIERLAKITADSCYGAGLGLAGKDDISCLTLVPSMLDWHETGCTLTCDIRFPVSHSIERYQQLLQKFAADNDFSLAILEAQQPMYAGKDNPTANTLLKAYREYSGDDSDPLVIGGGTYAKALKNFFAFGPEFADSPKVMHQANEFIRQEDLLKATKIYTRAIYYLAQ